MEIIIAVVAKIAEYTVAPVGQQLGRLGYVFRYTTNVENLEKQLQALKTARESLQPRVVQARNNCEEIITEVETWLQSVDEISEKANTFLNDNEAHAKALCSSCGSVFHLVTRHQRSRKATKMSTEVTSFLEKNRFDHISTGRRRQPESSFATIAKGYENFDSRKAILENIMAAVRDDDRCRIGLYGMGGIGKTMLAKEIARRAKEENLFSNVVITTISQTPDMKEIQQEIAGRLGLRFKPSESMGERADLLRMRLRPGESKILLILDDVWKKLDLEVIGIHDECKMLLTSRSLDVLRKSMDIAEGNNFSIEALDSREATSLFEKIIGEIVEKPDHKDLAHKIVGKCAGLPISIATVAQALNYETELYRWEDALKQLQSLNFTGIEGMHDEVYMSIRLSYDFLGSHEAKSLLLLCALHKEDEEIGLEDLMRYSVGCCLLQDVKTMKEARNRVNSIVDQLKSRCLLLDGRSKSYVKMHDVVRDVCKVIAKECPKLAEFLVLSSWSLKPIADDFFEQTRQLKALVMGNARLESLPPSFHLLQNLQTLRLFWFNLEDIAVIGELKNLKVLDLSECGSIKLLPKEIGELRRLQLLDLQGCHQLSVIEPNVISNMTQMEELYLPTEFQGWETEEDSMKERRNASLIEIKSLQLLSFIFVRSK